MTEFARKPGSRKPVVAPNPKRAAPPAATQPRADASQKLRELHAARDAAKHINRIGQALVRDVEALYAARERGDRSAVRDAVQALGMQHMTLEACRTAAQQAIYAAAPAERVRLQETADQASEYIRRISNATGREVPFTSVDDSPTVAGGGDRTLVTHPGGASDPRDVELTMHGFRVGPLVKNGGAPCDLAPGTGCVLDPTRRMALIQEYRGNVHAAQAQVHLALAELRVEAVLEKASSDDVSWVGAVLLDVLATFVTGKLGVAIRLGGAAAMGGAGGEERANDKRLDGLIKAAVGFAKRGIKPAKRPANPNVTLLDLFQEHADDVFARLRVNVPGQVNDLELLALNEAFHPQHHRKATYKAELLEKLARARRSGIAKIGRRYEDARDGRRVIRDVGVVWNLHASGRVELAYQHQDGYRPAQDHYRKPGPVPAEHELRDTPRSRGDAAGSARVFGPRRPFADDPVAGLADAPDAAQLVPPEFVASAIALHHAAWGTAPPIAYVGDRDHAASPARVQDGAMGRGPQ